MDLIISLKIGDIVIECSIPGLSRMHSVEVGQVIIKLSEGMKKSS